MKTTLELPDDLFREMKAAAALRGMKLRDFVTIAISEQLARMKKQNPSWSRRLPPAPRVSKTELKRIHRLIEEDSERIDTEDYLRKEELEALRSAAARSGRSVAELVREAIRKVVLKPPVSGPVAIWDGKPKHTSIEHDSIHDQP